MQLFLLSFNQIDIEHFEGMAEAVMKQKIPPLQYNYIQVIHTFLKVLFIIEYQTNKPI